MDLEKLPKIPDGAKKFIPYVVIGGVAVAVILTAKKAGNGSPVKQTGAGAPTPSNPFSSSSLSSPSGSVGGAPIQQVQPSPVEDGLNRQLSFFDAFYLPLGAGATQKPGATSAGTTGLSRFDFYNKSVLTQQTSQVELTAKQNQLQQQSQLDARKQEADIQQKQKDRDTNLFRNPSNFLKGIGDVGSSLTKVFGIKW